MRFRFVKINDDNFGDFACLFDEVFGNKTGNLYLDLSKKFDFAYTGVKHGGIIAYDENNNIAGALGIFPVIMKGSKGEIIAGQIGDAMVKPEYRKQGLFSLLIQKVLELSTAQGIELIFTFPSTNNQGSLRGFEKLSFSKKDTFHTFSISFSPSLLSRIKRKLNVRIQRKSADRFYHKLVSESAVEIPNQSHYSIPRSRDYINYKTYKNNKVLKLDSGEVWVSIGEFDIAVGDFKPLSNLNELLRELISIAKKTGKDTITFCTNVPEEINLLQTISEFKLKQDINLMVYFLNGLIEEQELYFNIADFDTF